MPAPRRILTPMSRLLLPIEIKSFLILIPLIFSAVGYAQGMDVAIFGFLFGGLISLLLYLSLSRK